MIFNIHSNVYYIYIYIYIYSGEIDDVSSKLVIFIFFLINKVMFLVVAVYLSVITEHSAVFNNRILKILQIVILNIQIIIGEDFAFMYIFLLQC